MKAPRPRVSLEARVLLLALLLQGMALGIFALVHQGIGEDRTALFIAPALLLPLNLLAIRAFTKPINRLLRVLTDAVVSLRDGDFSVSIASRRRDELGELAAAYNSIVDVLRSERQNLFQRELMLDTVMQSSPQALVLLDGGDRVVYSNTAARRLFHGGRRLEGLAFDALAASASASLREAALAEADGLYTVEEEAGESEIYHVSWSRFRLNTREHRLLQMRQLTRELTRQELATWKKVIRVISHELNNSLAPISSLAHSGRQLVRQDRPELMDEIFATIEERSARLKTFLDNYARFAKLPKPRREAVEWRGFLASLRRTSTFELLGDAPPAIAWFDPAQMQQVLINLLKNARDAGSAPEAIQLQVISEPGQFAIRVLDRGSGMSEAVLASALLPFYSTKSDGTGLGLTLCREIMEAHGGRLSLANREGGGLEVRLSLPDTAPSA